MSNANANQIFKDFPNAIFFSFSKIKATLRDDGKIDKQLVGLPLHGKINKTSINDTHKAFAMRTGAVSGVSVLDIDSVDVYEKLIERFDYLESCYKVRTRKGYHFYFNYDARLKNNSNCMDEYEGVDIRNDNNGFIICPPTKYKLPDGTLCKYTLIGGQIIDFPEEIFNLLNHRGVVGHSKPTKKIVKTKVVNKEGEGEEEEEVEENDEIANVTNRVKYSIQALSALINLLKPERSDNRDQWIIIGIVIYQNNSTAEGFQLFKQFSRMGKYKLSDNKLTDTWNSFNKNYANITIGTLKYFARIDNPVGYDALPSDLFDEPDHFNVSIIDQQYILSENGKSTKEIKNKLSTWYKDQKIIAFKSAYNTGKTHTLHYIIEKFNPKKILIITYRQTLTHNILGNFSEHNFKSYFDKNYGVDRLICQIDSLPNLLDYDIINDKVNVPRYDLIIFDESESSLSHLESPKIKDQLGTFNVFDALMKKSKHIIALDGDFGNRSYDYLKSVNCDNDFEVIQNLYVPSKKHWMFTNDKEYFDATLTDSLEKGEKIFMCSMSSTMADKYCALFEKDYKVLVHSSTSDDSLKTKLQTVNEFWIDYDLVICTPSVESGVDFNVEYFDRLYVVLSSGSTHQRGLNQMTNRVRKLKHLDVNCFLNGLPYYEKANLYTLDETEVMFKNHLVQLGNYGVNAKGDFENTQKTFNCINKYNYLEKLNKNIEYFVPLLLKMLKQKQQTWEFDNTEHTKSKEKSITKQELCATPNITKDEYVKLLALQKQNKASKSDKLKIERYMYKINWDLTELDDYTMEQIYRKTHIYFNNKAINNLPSKPFDVETLKVLGEDGKVEYLSIDDGYIQLPMKIKQQKLKIINEVLQLLTFKNSKNEFTNKVIEKEDWEKLVLKVKQKSTIFNDNSFCALFNIEKIATQKIATNKAFLGFLNTLLANYGVNIKTKAYGKNMLKSKTFIEQDIFAKQDNF